MSFVLTDANLPAILNCHAMTDDEFSELCAEHPDLSFEMTAEGELIVMAPTFTRTGFSCMASPVRVGRHSPKDEFANSRDEPSLSR